MIKAYSDDLGRCTSQNIFVRTICLHYKIAYMVVGGLSRSAMGVGQRPSVPAHIMGLGLLFWTAEDTEVFLLLCILHIFIQLLPPVWNPLKGPHQKWGVGGTTWESTFKMLPVSDRLVSKLVNMVIRCVNGYLSYFFQSWELQTHLAWSDFSL